MWQYFVVALLWSVMNQYDVRDWKVLCWNVRGLNRMTDSVQFVRKSMKVHVPLLASKKQDVRSLISVSFASVVHDVLINLFMCRCLELRVGC